MSWGKRILLGCLGLPTLLVASCTGKMYLDRALYSLPGEVLRSSSSPTQTLASGMQVAEALDSYVQPRFEILRDKNFGAIRIVYRKHAGIVQLKVDSPEEKALIANVNAAGRDYAISLLHCAPKPNRGNSEVTPKLELLYFNQQPLIRDTTFSFGGAKEVAEKNHLDLNSLQEKAVDALPELMADKKKKVTGSSWEILMRPVLASKPACVSCHTNAKLGSTLGVMVYAVRKK
jgi:hypothetical protein